MLDQSIEPLDLRELASLIAQAYKIRSERLCTERSRDLATSQSVEKLVDLKSAEEKAYGAACDAIDMCSLSDKGKLEAWKIFTANYP